MRDEAVTVKMFGLMHTLRRERNLPTVTEMALPPAGLTGREIAELLDLPVDKIEAIICNHTARGLDYRVLPGDTIAILPYGTPGPHRHSLGIHEAGKEN